MTMRAMRSVDHEESRHVPHTSILFVRFLKAVHLHVLQVRFKLPGVYDVLHLSFAVVLREEALLLAIDELNVNGRGGIVAQELPTRLELWELLLRGLGGHVHDQSPGDLRALPARVVGDVDAPEVGEEVEAGEEVVLHPAPGAQGRGSEAPLGRADPARQGPLQGGGPRQHRASDGGAAMEGSSREW
eukprot:CAMPEP_0171181588 /NCGR_PEP_ID=MMETSP0790-20130122/14334_1 /TAXON_ID=2925 /ORGANISM="Alexandrium catenella, Strain OF101" /LENGTH=186 /DNA_ID=CAMNT_0011646525 /DNA_START=118 /DNA_END=675 /DNA_ORIENTATION=+